MNASVIINGHTMDRYEDICEAIESVQNQTHVPYEVIFVSDGNEELAERVNGERLHTKVVLTEENVGCPQARNRGAERASGDLIAFLDDDAVAHEEWLEHLVENAMMTGYPAVGGRMVAQWQTERPMWLPDEFLWLVGVTHEGFGPNGDPGEEGPVRNTFGSNIAFRREVFEDLGGFGGMMGRQGDSQMQAGETELCARMYEETGQRVWYDPDAIVEHKIPEERTRPEWLLRRAWGQGRSKAQMSIGDEESSFVSHLVRESVPRHLSSVLGLFALTAVVGLGWASEKFT